MPHRFPDDVVTAVLTHMNSDHRDDNSLIARAFVAPSSRSATMTGFDGHGGDWDVIDESGTAASVRIAWPGGEITERPAVRREIVALYTEACDRLGVAARPH